MDVKKVGLGDQVVCAVGLTVMVLLSLIPHHATVRADLFQMSRCTETSDPLLIMTHLSIKKE
jgi:hypothetical protein